MREEGLSLFGAPIFVLADRMLCNIGSPRPFFIRVMIAVWVLSCSTRAAEEQRKNEYSYEVLLHVLTHNLH